MSVKKIKAAAVQRSGGLQLPKEMYRGGKGNILTENDIVKPEPIGCLSSVDDLFAQFLIFLPVDLPLFFHLIEFFKLLHLALLRRFG